MSTATSNKEFWIVRVVDSLVHFTPHQLNKRFSALAIFGAFFGWGVFATAATLHSQVEQVSMFTNFVSSLGWGPNGSHEVFKFGLVLLGSILFPYVLFLISKLRQHTPEKNKAQVMILTHRAATYWLAAVMGLWVLAWFIDIRVPNFHDAVFILALHGIGAATYFGCSVVGAYLLTKALAIAGLPYKLQFSIVAFIMLCTVGMTLSLIPGVMTGYETGMYQPIVEQGLELTMTPDERVNLISEITRAAPFAAFFEWMAVLSMLGWFAVTGTQTFLNRSHPSSV